MVDLPIVCELSPGDLSSRRESLLAELLHHSIRAEPIEAGYRLIFNGDTESIRVFTAAIEAERKCCRFLCFELRFEANLGPVALEITGPAGTREFLSTVLFPTAPSSR
jgi:hypothetical protein